WWRHQPGHAALRRAARPAGARRRSGVHRRPPALTGMPASSRRGGGDQRGSIAGKLFLLLLIAGLVTAGVFTLRAAGTPDLGDPPQGPVDGGTAAAIAVALAARAGPELLVAPTAEVSLSEQDLTVIVREANPRPDSFHDPLARVRDGLVVVDGAASVGPLHITAVGRFALSLVEDPDGLPDIAVALRAVDAGQLSLPGFARDWLAPRVDDTAAIGRILASA